MAWRSNRVAPWRDGCYGKYPISPKVIALPCKAAECWPAASFGCDCDTDANDVLGILWHSKQPFIESDVQKVEACDTCNRFTDEEAALIVARLYGKEAVFLEDREYDVEPEDRGNGYGFYGVRN